MESATTLVETPSSDSMPSIRLAIEGCGHGTLNNIYTSVTAACRAKSWPGIDLLIIGGDFQAVRNSYDLNAMSVPMKYREIGDFKDYYSGKRKAPYLTVFIGGNHEASNYLTELYYGGWVAPKIYYLGAANVLRFGGLRIAGMSGIWKGYDYRKPHFERLPYSEDDKKSVYHVRELDARKLLQIRTQVDVGLSHDWPEGIQWCGDSKQLFRSKPFFEADARSGRLGNIAVKQVLERLRPKYWFSAHMHVRFTAIVKHDGTKGEGVATNGITIQDTASQDVTNFEEIELDLDELEQEKPEPSDQPTGIVANSDEIELDLVDEDHKAGAEAAITVASSDEIDLGLDDVSQKLPAKPEPSVSTTIAEDLRAQLPDSFRPAPPPEKLPFPKDIKNKETKFLALDKCLPRRHFLQLVEIPVKGSNRKSAGSRPTRLEYDKEWLAITRVFAKDLVIGDPNAKVPRYEGDAIYRKRIEEEEAWVQANIVATGKTLVPENFVSTAPVYNPTISIQTRQRPVEYPNPQTQQFCDLLQIKNPLSMSDEERLRRETETAQFNANHEHSSGRGRGHFGGGRGGRGRGRGRGR